jgi:hypothetical protein
MNNFSEMPFGNDLLLAMYNTPTKELSTEQIAEIITAKLSTEEKPVIIGKGMVSAIYSKLGATLGKDLDLRKRLRVEPKEESNKPARVTKADVLNNVFGLLGIAPAINGETDETTNDEPVDDGKTEQEQQHVDEAVETNQFKELRENPVAPNHFGRNTESIYTNQDGTDVVENNQFGTGSRLGFN